MHAADTSLIDPGNGLGSGRIRGRQVLDSGTVIERARTPRGVWLAFASCALVAVMTLPLLGMLLLGPAGLIVDVTGTEAGFRWWVPATSAAVLALALRFYFGMLYVFAPWIAAVLSASAALTLVAFDADVWWAEVLAAAAVAGLWGAAFGTHRVVSRGRSA